MELGSKFAAWLYFLDCRNLKKEAAPFPETTVAGFNSLHIYVPEDVNLFEFSQAVRTSSHSGSSNTPPLPATPGLVSIHV